MGKIVEAIVSLVLLGQVKASTFSESEPTSFREGDQGLVDAAFERSSVVLDAKVVFRTEIWTMGGELTSQEEVHRVHRGVEEFVKLCKEKYGDEESLEKQKFIEKWKVTDIGRKSSQILDCLTLVTLSPKKVVKGDLERLDQVIHSSWKYWNSGVLQASDFGVHAESKVGSIVRVFLKPGWEKQQGVIPVGWNSILIGSTKMEPTISLREAREMIVGAWRVKKLSEQEGSTPEITVSLSDKKSMVARLDGKEFSRGTYNMVEKKDGKFLVQFSNLNLAQSDLAERSNDPFWDDNMLTDAYFIISGLKENSMILSLSDSDWGERAKVPRSHLKRMMGEDLNND